MKNFKNFLLVAMWFVLIGTTIVMCAGCGQIPFTSPVITPEIVIEATVTPASNPMSTLTNDELCDSVGGYWNIAAAISSYDDAINNNGYRDYIGFISDNTYAPNKSDMTSEFTAEVYMRTLLQEDSSGNRLYPEIINVSKLDVTNLPNPQWDTTWSYILFEFDYVGYPNSTASQRDQAQAFVLGLQTKARNFCK